MDAGCEHTMLGVGVAGKFVVSAVGDRWTTSCCFASSGADVAFTCSRFADAAIEDRPTAGMTVVFQRV